MAAATYIRRSTDEDNLPYSPEARETKLRAFVTSSRSAVKGNLDDEDLDIQARLANLRAQSKQLRADKACLEFDLDRPPAGPPPQTWR